MSHFKEEEKNGAGQRISGTAPGRPARAKVFADCVRTPGQPASCFVQTSFKHEEEISIEKEGGEKKTGEQRQGNCWSDCRGGFNGEGELNLCYLCHLRFIPRDMQTNEHSCTPTSILDLDFKKNKRIGKLVRDYASIYVKFVNCHQRVKFLRVCPENDIIPDFLRFRVPENGVFLNQAVHSFQTKFLRTEVNMARTDEKNVEIKLEMARGAVQRGVEEKFWPSVIKYLRLRGQRQTTTVKETHQKKLMKLSERQDRPLGKQGEGSVTALDDAELPNWLQHVLALGPKYPVRDKINEIHFLADIEIFLSKIVKTPEKPFVRPKLWQKPVLKG